MTDLGTGFDATAGSWVEHLRHGGTTPWLAWLDASHPALGQGRPDGPHLPATGLPGAAQLELLRRLNLGAATSGRRPLDPAVAELVLHRAGPGRGLALLPLVWPVPGRPATGPTSTGPTSTGPTSTGPTSTGRAAPPVDPATVSAGELLRVGAGVLADLVARLPGAGHPDAGHPDTGHPDTGRPGSRRAWRPSRAFRRHRHPSFRLEGPPLTVARVRSALAALGVVEHERRLSWLGGRRPESAPDVVLVLVEPVEDMLFEVWSHRAQQGSPRQWARFAEDWRGRGHLPPSARLDRVAAGWAARLAPERVHLLAPLDPAGTEGAGTLALVAEVLGLAPGEVAAARTRDPHPPHLGLAPVLVDVLRRYSAVAALHLPAAERQAALDRLLAVVTEDARLTGPDPTGPDQAGPPRLGVPPRLRAWATATGERMAADLRRGGYAVHGDPAVLGRVAEDRPGTLRPADVLAALVEVVLVVAAVAGRPQQDPDQAPDRAPDREVRR